MRRFIFIGLLWAALPGVVTAQKSYPEEVEAYLAKDNVTDFNYFESGEERKLEQQINQKIEEIYDDFMRRNQGRFSLGLQDVDKHDSWGTLESLHKSFTLYLDYNNLVVIEPELHRLQQLGYTDISKKINYRSYAMETYVGKLPELMDVYKRQRQQALKPISSPGSDMLTFDDFFLVQEDRFVQQYRRDGDWLPNFVTYPAIESNAGAIFAVSEKLEWFGKEQIDKSGYFSNSDKYFITSITDPGIYSNKTYSELFDLSNDIKSALCYCAFAPGDATVACGDVNGYLYLWDVFTGKLLYRNKKHKDLVQHVAFSSDGKWLATASYDNNIIVWDATSGKATYLLKGHTDGVMNLAFHPDGQMLASASKDRTIRIWDFKSEQQTQINRDYSDEAYVVTYSNDGQYLFSGSKSGIALQHETANINNTKQILSGTDPVYMVAFDAKGSNFNLVTASNWYKFYYGKRSLSKPSSGQRENISTQKLTVGQSDVDVNIPATATQATNTYALIVGNEQYHNEIAVQYANTDAAIFKKYAERTLGIPANNIKYLENASYGQMLDGLDWINNVAKALQGKARLIFYYAGHGMPDNSTQDAYLLPVDGSSSRTSVAVALNEVYGKLTEYPTQSTTVFLDACFSGASREGMLASGRGVAIKPKSASVSGNMVVFSAVSGEQTAHPYTDKQHGLFTYYLLKKLQATKGEVTLQELGNYISSEVSRQSILVNRKEQTPQVNVSPAVSEQWGAWKLK